MRLTKTLVTLPLAFALVANAGPVVDKTYVLAMTITDNGDLIGQPKLKVKAGETAMIQIEPGDGRKYHASFVIEAKKDGTLGVKSDWNAVSPTLGTVSFKPEMKVAAGEEAQIVYGYEAPGITPLDVKYTVTIVD
jgi:hypothetical protein